MSELTLETFFAFSTHSEWRKVKLMLRSHEGLDQIKNALIDFLATWNGREWVDW